MFLLTLKLLPFFLLIKIKKFKETFTFLLVKKIKKNAGDHYQGRK
jgi:hypothetical protein